MFNNTNKSKFTIILLVGFLLIGSNVTSAQNKGTCLVDNKVTYDCDLSKYKDRCIFNGQILPCSKKTPEKKCADSGPLIIKLNEATGYYERSDAYGEMYANLYCRGIYVGFLGAASDVTKDFNRDKFGIGKEADKFLEDTSAKLTKLNGNAFKEISESGKLRKSDGSGYLTDPAEIDTELIRREQSFVQQEYDKLPISTRSTITKQINEKIKTWISTGVSPSLRSMAEVRKTKRLKNPNAEIDYSNISDRIAIGEILAKNRRMKPGGTNFGIPVKTN